MKDKVEKELVLTKAKLADLQQQKSPFKIYLQKEVPMLENIVEFYNKSNGATKKKILGSIFAEKLAFEKGKVTTPVFREPVQLIMMISEGLGRSKKNQEVETDLLSNLVPQTDERHTKLMGPLISRLLKT